MNRDDNEDYKETRKEKHETEEWLEMDNARRQREYEIDRRRPY